MKEVMGLDIGGTNFRISVLQIKNNKPLIVKQHCQLTKTVENISDAINKFSKGIDRACIGFAGPIVEGKGKLTNANLSADVSKIKRETGLKEVTLINDFHAIGIGVNFLDKKDFLVLGKGKGLSNNVQMVIGPGTGLGKAYMIDKKVYPCEGGLITLGIEDIEEYALLDYLKHKYNGPVYYEDIISGRGLLDIYDHLEIKSNLEINFKIRKLIKEEPVNKAKLITEYSKQDKLCDMTMRIFTRFYARFVRDSVLNQLASKVYLAGGISGAIKPYLKRFFMQEFLKHRKYTKMLERVEVSVILNPDVGIIGSGAVAGKLI